MSPHKPSVIPVIVELGPELAFLVARKEQVARLTGRIAHGLTDLAHQLGIPGRPKVEVKTSDASLPRLFVHGSPQLFPLQLIQELFASISDSGPRVRRLTFSWQMEIKEFLAPEKNSELLAKLVVEVAKQRPAILLGVEQVAVYVGAMQKERPGAMKGLDLARVERILRYLLKLGVSITDTAAITEHLSQAGVEKLDDNALAESLASRLRSNAIRIEMQESYLHALFGVRLAPGQPISVTDKDLNEQIRSQFKMLYEGLFYELGIRVPDIVLAPSTRMQDGCFSIRINTLEGVSTQGLGLDQLLVNETVANVTKIEKDPPKMSKAEPDLLQRLRITPSRPTLTENARQIEASEAINPANDKEASIVGSEDKEAIERNGLYVWDPLGYLILALSRTLRQNAWRLLHIDAVEYELAQLYEECPELVSVALEQLSVSHLTQILRELLADQISIRDLRAILERVLTYDYVVTDPSKFIIFDDRLAFSEEPNPEERNNPRHYAQYVRTGLKQYLTHKLTRGQSTLIVYLMDPEIEKQIIQHLAAEQGKLDKTPLSAEQFEKILAAVRGEVKAMPPAAIQPVILTISEIRAFVRQLVAPEFPNLFVVAYDELSPDANIQPIARISF